MDDLLAKIEVATEQKKQQQQTQQNLLLIARMMVYHIVKHCANDKFDMSGYQSPEDVMRFAFESTAVPTTPEPKSAEMWAAQLGVPLQHNKEEE